MTVSHAPLRLQGGQAVLNYKVLRELGSRTEAVYAAHSLVNGRLQLSVLQHFLRPTDAASQLGGILRDARAVAEIGHPNLVRVHSAEPVGQEIVVVSEFIEGESLAELQALAAAQNTDIPLDVKLRIVLETLAGAAALHGTKDSKRRVIGLFHGLISPAEIIVGLDGTSRLVGVFHSTPLRAPEDGKALGGYFAPEVLLGDRVVDRRADVYAAGVFLWEALAGTRLFPDNSDGQVLARHFKGPLERPSIPAGHAWAAPLADIALRALSTDAKARYETAEEMIAAIQSHAKIAPASAVSTLVRKLAGESILRRRGEFADESARAQSDEDRSITAISPQRASGVEPVEDDTVTATVTAPDSGMQPIEDEPHDDSITAIAPSLHAVQAAHVSIAKVSSIPKITPAAGVPPPSRVPSTKVDSGPPTDPTAPIDDHTEASITHVRPPETEADEQDDSVTALAQVPEELRLRASHVQQEEIDTVTRDRVAPELIEAAARRSLERERASRGDDDDHHTDVEEEDVVTAIAPMMVNMTSDGLPRGDDSVTQDRPPIAQTQRLSGSVAQAQMHRPSAGSLGVFPPPTALPSSIRTPAPVPRHVVEVHGASDEDALGQTMNAEPGVPYQPGIPAPHPMPPQHAIPMGQEQSAGSELEMLPPPSYKRLGIALGFAVVAAFALLVYVINRAASQGEIDGIAAIDHRAKATHRLAWSDGDEQVSPATKKFLASQQKKPPTSPSPRRR